jgi:hypothetical protein
MRKRNSPVPAAFLAAAILASAACADIASTTAKIDIPAAPAVKLDGIEEIAVADFFVDPPVKDFAAGPALVSYFRETMKNEFKGRLSAVPAVWTDANMAENKEAWMRLLAVPKDKLILTGRLQYVQDVRKALTAADRRAIDDGPFAPQKAWAERKNFELKLELFVIRAETGEIAFRKDFQEAIIVENKKQTTEYAFYDLLQRLRLKLFRLLFGSVRSQERYLLSR